MTKPSCSPIIEVSIPEQSMQIVCRVKHEIIISLFILSGLLCVYLLTLAPSVLGGDAGELQFVPYILGLPHPTGYPLICLLGKLWSYIPIGTVAYRMNLLSAVFASLAALGFYLTARRFTRSSISSLLGALTLALSHAFWSQAVISDKYAFNALFVVLISGLALVLIDKPEPARLYILAFFLGLSLTHHRSSILFGPPLLLAIGFKAKKIPLKPGIIAKALLLSVAPLILYVYIPIAATKGLPPGTWQINNFHDFVSYIADVGYVKRVGITIRTENISYYVKTLLQNLTFPGAVLGLIGLIASLFKARVYGLFLLTAFLLQAYLSLNYEVPRRWVFFLPSFILYTFWISRGAALLLELPEKVFKIKRWIYLSNLLVILMLAVIPASLFKSNYPHFRELHLNGSLLDIWRQELKHGHAGERLGLALKLVEPKAIIVCDWEQATIFWYMQQVEGLRRDVFVKYPIESLEEMAKKAQKEGRPLYLARTLPGITHRWHPVSVGPLIWLRDEPNYKVPPNLKELKANFGDQLELVGFKYEGASFKAGSVIPVTLYWRALTSLQADYSISIRLFDDAGKEILKIDCQHPVLGTYPTSKWRKDEVISDYYEIPLIRSLPLGRYRWGVIVYRVLPNGGWENLKLVGSPVHSEIAFCDEFELKRED